MAEDNIGVWEPDVAAINTNMLIVAVSITSRENSEFIKDFEFSIPKHPIIKRTIAGKSITVSSVTNYIILKRVLILASKLPVWLRWLSCCIFS